MYNYDVYGLGNALLDIEIKVDDDKLKDLEIEKGVMTLIDQSRHQHLIDVFAKEHKVNACGGSAANTLIAVAQLGGRGFYSCKVASDASGEHFLTDLLSHGLKSNLKLTQLEQGNTGICLAFVTPDAERTMNTFLGITEQFSRHELDEEALAASQYIYIEGYLVTSPTGRDAAIRARQFAESKKVKTTLTLSDPNMTEHFADGLKDMIGERVDFLFCNEAEAKLFAKAHQLEDACQYLASLSRQFVVTQGAKGALVYDGNSYHQVPGVETDVVDTLGAGDMFAGAFLTSLAHGKSPCMAAEKANIAASQVVSKFGPRLDDKERDELLKQWKSHDEVLEAL